MIDTDELRRKVNSTDIVDRVDLHANIKPFLSELIGRLEAAEKAVTEAYQRGYETGQEEIAAERDALRTALEKIADWDSAWGPFPETNEAWRAMAIVTAREAVPRRGE